MTKKLNELDLDTPVARYNADVTHMQKAISAGDEILRILEEVKADNEAKKTNPRS